jgi:methionyl-tRNA formyltransferase
VRILFAGTPEVTIPALEWIQASNHDLVAVLTRPAAAQGRSSELIDSPVAKFAMENKINVFTSLADLRSEKILESVDLVVVIAYGKLIPEELLKIPKHGWINVHFSILPKYRGAAPVQRAIWNGEEESGISIFQLDAGMDTGPIFAQQRVSISSMESAGECLKIMSEMVPNLLGETLVNIEKLGKPTSQPKEGSSLAPKIEKSESIINWSGSAISIKNMVRALNPAPRAKTTFRDNDLFIYEVEVSQISSTKPVGTISFVNQKLYVATGDFDLEILKVQSAGKKVISGSEWGRGYQMKADPIENKYV